MLGPDPVGSAIEVWTDAGHDKADPVGRGGTRPPGEKEEATYSAEADVRQIDNKLGGLSLQRRNQRGARQRQGEGVDVASQLQHCDGSCWTGVDVEMLVPQGGELGHMDCCSRAVGPGRFHYR